MTILIGSARSDERGKYSGGQRGDQRQTSSPDYAGEVSVQAFYLHSKGWYILRPKEASVAVGIAAAMQAACNNKCVGYSQSDRYAILKVGTGTKTPTNADCSSLVRQCVKEATGKDPGDFTTGTEVAALGATGLFKTAIPYTSGTALYTGDVLVTKTKGHTVVVVQGNPRSIPFGWVRDGIKWRFYEPAGPVTNDWRLIDTTTGRHWYWFDGNGYMATGWQFISNHWYFFETTQNADEGALYISDASGAQFVWTLE